MYLYIDVDLVADYVTIATCVFVTILRPLFCYYKEEIKRFFFGGKL